MPPRTNIDRLYEAIVDRQNAKHDRRGESYIPDHPLSERELAELAAIGGGDSRGYTMVDDVHMCCPDGSVVHVERLVR